VGAEVSGVIPSGICKCHPDRPIFEPLLETPKGTRSLSFGSLHDTADIMERSKSPVAVVRAACNI